MLDNGKRFIITFTVAILLIVVSALGAIHHSSDIIELSDELYNRSEDVLAGYIRDGGIGTDKEFSVLHDERLSQQVTVTTAQGLMTIGGTVTRCEDDFYPGTYEVKFSRNAIMSFSAKVYVRMDVEPGDTVHVLTGNKESGYREYATVEAAEKGLVVFDTNVIRDYTISTTDIKGAQEAMETLFASNTTRLHP